MTALFLVIALLLFMLALTMIANALSAHNKAPSIIAAVVCVLAGICEVVLAFNS